MEYILGILIIVLILLGFYFFKKYQINIEQESILQLKGILKTGYDIVEFAFGENTGSLKLDKIYRMLNKSIESLEKLQKLTSVQKQIKSIVKSKELVNTLIKEIKPAQDLKYDELNTYKFDKEQQIKNSKTVGYVEGYLQTEFERELKAQAGVKFGKKW